MGASCSGPAKAAGIQYKTCLTPKHVSELMKWYVRIRDENRHPYDKGRGPMVRMDLVNWIPEIDDTMTETVFMRVLILMSKPVEDESHLDALDIGGNNHLKAAKFETDSKLSGSVITPSEWCRLVETLCVQDDRDMLVNAFNAFVRGGGGRIENTTVVNLTKWKKTLPAFGEAEFDMTHLDKPFWTAFRKLERMPLGGSGKKKVDIEYMTLADWEAMCQRSERCWYPLKWWRRRFMKYFLGKKVWSHLKVVYAKKKASNFDDGTIKDTGLRYARDPTERDKVFDDMPAEHRAWLMLKRKQRKAKMVIRVASELDSKQVKKAMDLAKAPRRESYGHLDLDRLVKKFTKPLLEPPPGYKRKVDPRYAVPSLPPTDEVMAAKRGEPVSLTSLLQESNPLKVVKGAKHGQLLTGRSWRSAASSIGEVPALTRRSQRSEKGSPQKSSPSKGIAQREAQSLRSILKPSASSPAILRSKSRNGWTFSGDRSDRDGDSTEGSTDSVDRILNEYLPTAIRYSRVKMEADYDGPRPPAEVVEALKAKMEVELREYESTEAGTVASAAELEVVLEDVAEDTIEEVFEEDTVEGYEVVEEHRDAHLGDSTKGRGGIGSKKKLVGFSVGKEAQIHDGMGSGKELVMVTSQTLAMGGGNTDMEPMMLGYQPPPENLRKADKDKSRSSSSLSGKSSRSDSARTNGHLSKALGKGRGPTSESKERKNEWLSSKHARKTLAGAKVGVQSTMLHAAGTDEVVRPAATSVFASEEQRKAAQSLLTKEPRGQIGSGVFMDRTKGRGGQFFNEDGTLKSRATEARDRRRRQDLMSRYERRLKRSNTTGRIPSWAKSKPHEGVYRGAGYLREDVKREVKTLEPGLDSEPPPTPSKYKYFRPNLAVEL